jgi:D-glycero-alpha-D-manno-heptose 1-phosphate guanylyltransferase
LEAIVLAGGLGTRLRNVIGESPKSMAPVNGRPFLEYLFDWLILGDIHSVILSVGYKREMIMNHFGGHYKSLSLLYSSEDQPLGTGGGILKAMSMVSGKDVYTLNGDSLFRIKLPEMQKVHIENRSDLTIALRHMDDTSRYGSVNTDPTGKINGFHEKGSFSGPGYINGGIYLINRDFFCKAGFPEKFSLEKDCFEHHYKDSSFFGYPADDYFLDIGIPEDYEKAQDDFK